MGESEPIRVGIIGASGYGGIQLVRLLQEHPHAQITYLGGSSSAGKTYTDIYPHLQGDFPLQVEAVEVPSILARCDLVFLSLPNGIAYDLAPQLLAEGCKVIDLSADYRFAELQVYRAWYGGDRTDDAINTRAVYGLPELFRDRIQEADLIGCPGCYPTASLL
ncbi:MAG: N-acetyl-gamma-glutamyl-phosphate reductase, partial [Cyanobacteria bacterium P01_F01_bin.86]